MRVRDAGHAPGSCAVRQATARAGDSQRKRGPPQLLALAHSPALTCAFREEMRAMNSRADLALPV